MNYLRNIGRATRHLGRAMMGVTSGYEGASTQSRMSMWTETDADINRILASEGATLRRRSRALVRKDAWAKNAQEVWVSNCIGTGITPESRHPDAEMRAKIERAWSISCEELDADNLTDFYGLQALAMREIFEAGEILIRSRSRFTGDGLLVPLQFQLIEAEHLPLNYSTENTGSNPIKCGIEFSATIDNRVAYHLHKNHPGSSSWAQSVNPTELRRVSVERVIHGFEPLRAGMIRGTPWLAPVMVPLYELDQFIDATLVKQKVSNFFVGWMRSISDEIANALMQSSQDANGNVAPEGINFGSVNPGTVVDLGPTGATMEWSKPPDPSAAFPDFVKTILRMVACGVGIPYTRLNWDTSDSTFASERSEMLEFRRRVEQKQFQLICYQICRPIWRQWLNTAVLAGVLPKPANREEWASLYSVTWRTPRWAWVDPLKDVLAAERAVRDGFTSKSAVIREMGYDPEDVDRERAADNARADALGLVDDSDPRQTTNSGIAQQQMDEQNQQDRKDKSDG